MGRRQHKKYKNNNRAVAARGMATRSPVVSLSEWERLAADSEQKGSFLQLVNALQRAQSEAEQMASRTGYEASDLIDLSEVQARLARNPSLRRFVANAIETGGPFRGKASPIAAAHEDTQNSSNLAGWTGDKRAPQAVMNARVYRRFADENEWVRAAVNLRRQQVSRANISVAPENPSRRYDKKTQYNVEFLLDQPNEYRTTYDELMGAMTEDLIVLDRGCLSKDMTIERKPVGLYYEDGGAIKVYANWSGDPDEPRYLWDEPGGRVKVPLRNDELICMAANPASYRLCLSPIAVLYNTIQADLNATKNAMRMVDFKPPPQMIQIQGASPTQLAKVRDKYESEIAGEKQVFWIGGNGPAQVFPLVWSAKDQQFLEWQLYMARKICAILQCSPQQLGITFDINKATAGVQQEIAEDQGRIPLLLLIEGYMNREILGDFAPPLSNGRVNLNALNLRIFFPEISEADRMLHAERAIQIGSSALAGLPSMTLNMILRMWGEEDVEGGNTFYVPANMTPVPWLSYDGSTGDYNGPTTGGTQGSQDAAGGGPSSDEKEPSSTEDMPDNVSDNPTGENTETSPGAAAPGAAAPGAEMGSDQATKTLRQLYLARYDTGDYRAPGKRWTPSVHRAGKQAARKGVTSLGRAREADARAATAEPHGKAQARSRVHQAALSFYEDATDAMLQAIEAQASRYA
jgi:hypothetical protein